jgi:hypothetical protein
MPMWPRADRLLRLYPRAWRDRYGEDFLATVGDGTLGVQQVIDIVSGAADAWLSADVRGATRLGGVAQGEGGSLMVKTMVCGRTATRYTTRDGAIGAAVMLLSSLLLTTLGVVLRRDGWLTTGEAMTSLAFPVSLTLSMPFWIMKGQPWKAQVAIVGGTLLILLASGYVAALL